MPIHNFFVYDGKSSLDFGVGISGTGTFKRPHRRVERFTIPGRNGTLTISDGTFEDIEISYPAYFVKDFPVRYDALCAWLFSKQGMLRLEDTYSPEHFRLAEFVGDIDPNMGTLNQYGTFELRFRCDGRKFLKSGERLYVYTQIDYDSSMDIHPQYGRRIVVVNPTPYVARPIWAVIGIGTLRINDATIKISGGEIDFSQDAEESPYLMGLTWNGIAFDSDSFEGYDTQNKGKSYNHLITVEGDPVLLPGENHIVFNLEGPGTVTPFAMIPRWHIV